ncbi:MAG: alkaline phosphatase family protein, partial [Planctomycetes bacterium]|nr:alkaline phosphatase family protein [Planctomycetota bacterium]
MKIFAICLDCAAPELVLRNSRLPHLSDLMAQGCYGRLESVIPPITVPAWMCMATSQDPGSLGVYGFRNRTDYSYNGLGIVNSRSINTPAIWDWLAVEGKRAVVIGVPPGYPPRKVNGVSVGCFLTPDPYRNEFTYPASVKRELERLVGTYPVDVQGFRTDDKEWLRDQIYEMTRKHFEVVRYLMATVPWDYFQFVEIGLDRMHHGFWKFFDPTHRQYVPDNPYETVIPDYYAYLDEEIGKTLELLDEDTIRLVASDHGAQRLDGGFCVNEWLYREGLLALRGYPSEPTPFSVDRVDWARTKVWSEGGYYARVFLNVKGREPQGVVTRTEYESLLDDLTSRLEALPDDQGRVMGTRAFRPQHLYRKVRNVAPDLIVQLGGLYWRSIGGLGYPSLHVQENDTGPDDCNHAQFGVFILAAPSLSIRGEVEGMHLLDVAPTLLDLAGCKIPPTVQGCSLLRGTKGGKPGTPV